MSEPESCQHSCAHHEVVETDVTFKEKRLAIWEDAFAAIMGRRDPGSGALDWGGYEPDAADVFILARFLAGDDFRAPEE